MSPIETVREFIARICRHDLDGACELVTDDVEYDNAQGNKQFGAQGIRNVAWPDNYGFEENDWVIHREAEAGNVVFNERTDRVKVRGTWIELPVCGVFEFSEEGKIRHWCDYFDLAMFTSAYEAAQS